MSRLPGLASAVVCCALAGCVSAGQHQAALDERDRLREEGERLAASVAALGSERDRLAGEIEDLRQSSAATARDCDAQLAARSARVDELHATYEALVKDLEAQLASGQSQIEQLREGLRTSLSSELLFAPGAADLSAEGERVLRDLAERFRDPQYAAYRIQVEGHTDGSAVRGALAQRFPSNWELAGARAARVVRALADDGVETSRLVAVSRGAEAPIAPNDTPEGRAANRRIEIRLLPVAERVPATAADAAPRPPEAVPTPAVAAP
jgi:chemotaxis protein MotB